jgi:5-methyltetrahydrofolate--homocysteine methyltransferase
MDQSKKLRGLLEQRLVFLDGASGTELMKRGMPAGANPEAWAMENTDTVRDLHQEYLSAGADVILTCTFGGTGMKLGDATLTGHVNHRMGECAIEAAGDSAIAAASMGPTGQLLYPSGNISWIQAYEEFGAQARALVETGIDVFFLETFSDPRELKAAVLAVRDACPDGFISAQMSFESGGLTLAGTSPTALAVLLDQLPVDAAGANCGYGPEELLPVAQEMLRFSNRYVSVEPNAGLPVDGVWEMTPGRFAGWMEDFAWSGVSILGGCCGTGPDHVRDYVSLIGNRPIKRGAREALPLLSSVDRTVRLGQGLLIVGESINPTGRKNLQSSIRSGDSLAVVSLARAQGRADIVDVNLGLERMLPEGLVDEVFGRLSIGPPLSVDLSEPENIERAFRQMGGIGILNSLTSCEKSIRERVDTLLRHGGYAVLLPLDEGGPGETPLERLEILRRGISILAESGFPRERIIADPIVRPVGTGADISTVLKTLDLFKEEGLLTIAGISNVSHGMPDRSSLNSAMLSSMGTRGLDLAIADVLDAGTVSAARSVRTLTGNLEQIEMKVPELDPQSPSPDFLKILQKSIIVGDRRQTEASARELLESGWEAVEILSEGLSPAMDRVGDLYSRRKLFLPHLIAAAEASKVLTRLLSPHLSENGAGQSLGKVVLASVKGDVHDIGKNLVGLFLSNSGFTVIDLGKDVPGEEILRRADEEDADIVALSALMSTTAPEMEKVIAAARRSGSHAMFLVGGAVLSREYADSIGADGYARDAHGAAGEARRLMEGMD